MTLTEIMLNIFDFFSKEESKNFLCNANAKMKGYRIILVSYIVHLKLYSFVDARVTKSNHGYSRDNEEDLMVRFLQVSIY